MTVAGVRVIYGLRRRRHLSSFRPRAGGVGTNQGFVSIRSRDGIKSAAACLSLWTQGQPLAPAAPTDVLVMGAFFTHSR